MKKRILANIISASMLVSLLSSNIIAADTDITVSDNDIILKNNVSIIITNKINSSQTQIYEDVNKNYILDNSDKVVSINGSDSNFLNEFTVYACNATSQSNITVLGGKIKKIYIGTKEASTAQTSNITNILHKGGVITNGISKTNGDGSSVKGVSNVVYHNNSIDVVSSPTELKMLLDSFVSTPCTINESTVKLSDNITLTSLIEIRGNMKLDLNGKEINSNSNCGAFYLSSGNFVIDDSSTNKKGKINGSVNQNTLEIAGGKFEVLNGNFDCGTYGNTLFVSNNPEVVLNAGTFSCSTGGNSYNSSIKSILNCIPNGKVAKYSTGIALNDIKRVNAGFTIYPNSTSSGSSSDSSSSTSGVPSLPTPDWVDETSSEIIKEEFLPNSATNSNANLELNSSYYYSKDDVSKLIDRNSYSDVSLNAGLMSFRFPVGSMNKITDLSLYANINPKYTFSVQMINSLVPSNTSIIQIAEFNNRLLPGKADITFTLPSSYAGSQVYCYRFDNDYKLNYVGSCKVTSSARATFKSNSTSTFVITDKPVYSRVYNTYVPTDGRAHNRGGETWYEGFAVPKF